MTVAVSRRLNAAVLGDGGFQSFLPHDRAVHLLFGKPAQEIGDLLVGDRHRLVKGLPLHHLGEGGGGGDGAAAAEGLEFGVYDAFLVFVQLYKEFKGIAAGQASHLADRISIRYLPHVPGVEEMFFYFIGVVPHRPSLLISPVIIAQSS